MPKINNSEVMQKLIDELELYPGKDIVPTELAEKIIATYQINSENVSVAIESNPVVYRDDVVNDQTKSFIVPAGKKWRILHISTKVSTSAVAGNRFITYKIKDETGTIIWYNNSSTGGALIASTTGYYFGNPQQDVDTWKPTGAYWHMPIPKDLILLEGMEVEVKIAAGGDAGDDLVYTLIVDEQDA